MQKSELKIEYLPIDEIRPYEKNARKHTHVDVSAIVASIREFGFDDPIGIWGAGNIIVEGHGRLMAAKKLGMTTVPVIRLDHLTDEQRRAYALAHNKTAEMSEWDFDVLRNELDDVFDVDMEQFGFNVALDDEPYDVVEDEVPEVPDTPKSKLGDIYKLGRHRLMCGNATSKADVQKLMNGAVADLVITDPPYNMNYQGAGKTRNRTSRRIMNDNMPKEEFRTFLVDVYKNYFSVMREGATIYVFYKELGEGIFLTSMSAGGLTYKQELIWVKDHLVLGGAKYQSQYEPFIMGCKGKSIKVWNGARNQRSVIESIDIMSEDEVRDALKILLSDLNSDILRERKQVINDLHPTMKPVRLIAKLISNSSNKNDVVLDLFGGSGTTMVAAEQVGRSAYLMELDPRFVDVIIMRYEQFTGGKAVLLNV